MGKDLPGKNLLNCPDVFADIGNVNLFGGEQLIQPEELEPQPTELVYKDSCGTMRHHYLDTRMKAAGHQTDIAIFCIENQSGVSNIMPVRDMGYLYSGYSDQIRKIQKENEMRGVQYITEGIGREQKLVPVVNVVLYYGQDEWTGAEKLTDMLELPEEWKERLGPYIAEHRVKVVRLAQQDRETRQKYRSDFRHVVDCLACAGDREECSRYIRDPDRRICHPEEYLDIMAAFSSDSRFAQIKENVLRKMEGEGEIAMFSIAEELENIGMEKGLEQGLEQGRKEGLEQGAAQKSHEIIRIMLGDGQPPELVSRYTKKPLEYVHQVEQEMDFVGEDSKYGDKP